jgi:hypothetical protein
MPDTDTQPSSEVAAVRAKLMEDLAKIEVTAAALDKSPRTIQRLIARGLLPTVTIGHTPYVVISRARELLMSAPKIRHAPVRKGRPVKSRAA